MAIAEKTYTFRASKDLAARASEALATLGSLTDLSEDEMSVFWIRVLRHARGFDQAKNQSAVFRTTLEAFVEAAEKLARDREHLRAYEEWAAEDEEGPRFRDAALEAGESRWSE